VKKAPYSSGPAVPASKIAGSNPFGTVALGANAPPTVPHKPGIIHGEGPETRPFGHPSVKGAHGFGHVAKHKHGHLRMSGHVGAHRIGGVKLPKGS